MSCDERFKKNIDRFGGEGTAEFVRAGNFRFIVTKVKLQYEYQMDTYALSVAAKQDYRYGKIQS